MVWALVTSASSFLLVKNKKQKKPLTYIVWSSDHLNCKIIVIQTAVAAKCDMRCVFTVSSQFKILFFINYWQHLNIFSGKLVNSFSGFLGYVGTLSLHIHSFFHNTMWFLWQVVFSPWFRHLFSGNTIYLLPLSISFKMLKYFTGSLDTFVLQAAAVKLECDCVSDTST